LRIYKYKGDDKMNYDNEQMMRKFSFYFEAETKLHISCNDGRFYNGIIVDLSSDKGLMVFQDRKIGPVPILFEEILKFEPFEEAGE